MKQILVKLSVTLLTASLLSAFAGAQWHHHYRYWRHYHRHVVVVYHPMRAHYVVVVHNGHRGYWRRRNGISVFIRL